MDNRFFALDGPTEDPNRAYEGGRIRGRAEREAEILAMIDTLMSENNRGNGWCTIYREALSELKARCLGERI